MSTLSTTNIKHPSSGSNNIVLASDGTTTIPTVKATTELLVGGVTTTANGGTLQISNGITFPATQSACSNANTLDDYEEGSWTPSGEFASNGTRTNVEMRGTYTKVGDAVHVNFYTQVTKGTASGAYRITGLPFAASARTFTIGVAGAADNMTPTVPVWGILDGVTGSSSLVMKKKDSSSSSDLTAADLNTSNAVFAASFTYFV